MILEDIEQHALTYLGQVTNPLVQVSVLYEYVRSKTSEDIFPIQDFTDFIKQHEHIKLMDPLSHTTSQMMGESLKASGFTTSPCAILGTRVPSSKDLVASMMDQMNSMTTALTSALGEARSIGDTEKAHQVYETIERIKTLEAKLIEFSKTS